MKMKKTFLILIVIFSFVLSMNGQTLLTEDFSGGQMPPEGWSIDGYNAQWTINQSNKAGGTVPEARFKYVNSTGVTRLISPEIDLTGYEHLNIAFKHFLDNYASGPKIGLPPDPMVVTGMLYGKLTQPIILARRKRTSLLIMKM